VIGVSPDSVKKHASFKAKRGYTYALVADTEHAVCEAYGVWAEKSMYGKKYWGVNRTTFHRREWADRAGVREGESARPRGRGGRCGRAAGATH